ncbi:DEAD/DEAH box helicase family protein [Alkalicoccus luteus]|uniref:DEAD/DEAH box helicase family protein n=1 Tax=Alkalicoccus luteus TaxID=1237094 RepID=UPI004033E3F3
MINLKQKEADVLEGLKDFQRETVERVYDLMTNDYTRVLVADEVGLGKTMVARGVVSKLARYYQERFDNQFFKVVYVCSNQSIASQNIKKLKIDDNIKLEDSSDTRLSMQHLKIYEEKYNITSNDNYIQLIPLTPTTSFTMTAGCGSVTERSLIYAVLKRYSLVQGYLNELDILLMDTATKGWKSAKDQYESRVEQCQLIGREKYINDICKRIDDFLEKNMSIIDELMEVLTKIKIENIKGIRVKGAVSIIYKLRRMMAEISVDIMNPDLVIMDEFQRFPELVNADSESETALLARKFFNSSRFSDEEKMKILLLSATPYKLYSTMEEIAETGEDEHYKEFLQVTGFLFEHHPKQQKDFKEVWANYSNSLRLLTGNDVAVIQAKKQEAEDSLYKGIARTERLAVEGSSDLISASVIPLKITREDILSYINMDLLLQNTGIKNKVPVDYVKSTPYLMSFMEHYKLKQKITQFVVKYPENIQQIDKPYLWLKKDNINNYKKLPDTNARLSNLKKVAFPNNAERLLWIPPSLPYYEFRGPYTGQINFSKLLIFSGWEMVPRAISTMLSYEAERTTVGELIRKTKKKKKKQNQKYFAEHRFPQPRLLFSIKDGRPASMNHLTLLYPSITLAKLFDPVDVLNRKLTLNEIKAEIKDKVKFLLNHVNYNSAALTNRADKRWYYIAPLLFDLEEALIKDWFNKEHLLSELEENSEDSVKDKSVLIKHLEVLQAIFIGEKTIELGKQPDDLVDVLVNMVLGSPAVCTLRMFDEINNKSLRHAVQLAKTLIDRMNTQEATAIIELEYGNKKCTVPHWQNLLKYNVDGNIQAMLDEYSHMIIEEAGLRFEKVDDRQNQLVQLMVSAFDTHTSSYKVDTIESFKRRIKGEHGIEQAMNIRTNYAVGFANRKNEETAHNRKNNVRLAFNSPMRPFVLATTSVGQEGLDFHYYCRKISHWNLPSNPVDLEQREGRINRYKCLAIRQNLATKYSNITFKSDIWQEMFQTANDQERDEHTPELVPFWSLLEKQDIKIERIVPIYPLSKDGVKYKRLMKIMQLYRLSLGQARQHELLEYLSETDLGQEQLKDLFMNLSPYYKEKGKLKSK